MSKKELVPDITWVLLRLSIQANWLKRGRNPFFRPALQLVNFVSIKHFRSNEVAKAVYVRVCKYVRIYIYICVCVRTHAPLREYSWSLNEWYSHAWPKIKNGNRVEKRIVSNFFVSRKSLARIFDISIIEWRAIKKRGRSRMPARAKFMRRYFSSLSPHTRQVEPAKRGRDVAYACADWYECIAAY